MFMNNKYNLSKKNISFFLIVVIVIGIIVVITQMANVKGSQKPVDQLNQNPNLGHLTKIKSVSTTIISGTNVSLTKPLAATNNINNVTKPLAATNNINNVTKPLAATNNINNVTKPLAATNNINNVTKPLAATNNINNVTKPLAATNNINNVTKPLAATNNINNVTKPLAATNNINNVTKPLAATNNINNVTKPLAATNNINNVTKPLAATNNNGSGTIESSQKNNTEMVNYQLFKTPKVNQVSNYDTLKKSLVNDVFGKSAKKIHGDSGNKKASKAKKIHGDSGNKDKLQSTQADNKLNTNNNFGENKKTSSIFKTHHNHKSTDPLSNDLNSNRSPRHNINDPSNSSMPSNTIDLPLPFTAGLPNNLF